MDSFEVWDVRTSPWTYKASFDTEVQAAGWAALKVGVGAYKIIRREQPGIRRKIPA